MKYLEKSISFIIHFNFNMILRGIFLGALGAGLPANFRASGFFLILKSWRVTLPLVPLNLTPLMPHHFYELAQNSTALLLLFSH